MKSKKKIFLSIFFVLYLLFYARPSAKATEIDTSPDPVYKKTLEFQKESDYANVYASPTPGSDPVVVGKTKNIEVPLSGETGPNSNSLKFPKLDKEYKYFSAQEFQDRVLPEELRGKVEFASPPPMQGEIAHVGCGKITVGGEQKDEARIGKSETTFDIPDAYGQNLMFTRFFQAIFVPSKDTDLKFSIKAPTVTPQPPDYLPDCQSNEKGQSADYSLVSNPPPKSLSLAKIFQSIWDAINNLLGSRDVVATDVKVQQIGYIPAEKQFEDQTVGKNGFLNFFNPEERPFSKEGDQVESVPYKVLGQPQDEKVGYLGMSSYKSGTVDLVKSLLPEELQSKIGEIVAPPSSQGLTYTLDYRDYGKVPSQDKKNEIIQRVKQNENWSDSLIDLYWDQVVQRSVDAKINPSFTLAIWIEESGASSSKVGAWSPFGCFPGGDTNQKIGFNRSLDCFIKFTAEDHSTDFTDWAKNFCGPGVIPICDNNPYFLDSLKTWYDRITL